MLPDISTLTGEECFAPPPKLAAPSSDMICPRPVGQVYPDVWCEFTMGIWETILLGDGTGS